MELHFAHFRSTWNWNFNAVEHVYNSERSKLIMTNVTHRNGLKPYTFIQYFVNYKLGNSTNSSAYASNFLQYHNFAAQIPNVVFNWLNIFVNLG